MRIWLAAAAVTLLLAGLIAGFVILTVKPTAAPPAESTDHVPPPLLSQEVREGTALTLPSGEKVAFALHLPRMWQKTGRVADGLLLEARHGVPQNGGRWAIVSVQVRALVPGEAEVYDTRSPEELQRSFEELSPMGLAFIRGGRETHAGDRCVWIEAAPPFGYRARTHYVMRGTALAVLMCQVFDGGEEVTTPGLPRAWKAYVEILDRIVRSFRFVDPPP